MRAVITVIGKDNVGILQANVLEVTQSVLQDMFAMIMMVDITKMTADFAKLSDQLTALGEELGLSVHCMHEDIFNAMHRI